MSSPGEAGAAADRRQRRRQALAVALLLLPPGLYTLLFFIIPLGIMGVYSFGEIDPAYQIHVSGTLAQYVRFVTTAVYPALLRKSLLLAGGVTLLALLLGYPAAYILAQGAPRRWRSFLLACLLLPAWTNLLIRTYAWIIILGQNGLVNFGLMRLGWVDHPLPLVFNSGAVVVALLCIYLPWMVLPIFTSLDKIDRALIEAGANLGAGPVQLFARIVLPLSLPGVVSGCLVVFIPAIGSYLTPMILGGPRGIMYANAVNDQFTILNWPFGSAMAMILLLIVLGGLALYFRLFRIERVFGL